MSEVKRVFLVLEMDVDADTDLFDLAEQVFEYMVNDPSELFPAIKVIYGYDVRGER
jgi:hypothetical protein